jgi:hypothetical protein
MLRQGRKKEEREREVLYGGSAYIDTANPNGNDTGGGF